MKVPLNNLENKTLALLRRLVNAGALTQSAIPLANFARPKLFGAAKRDLGSVDDIELSAMSLCRRFQLIDGEQRGYLLAFPHATASWLGGLRWHRLLLIDNAGLVLVTADRYSSVVSPLKEDVYRVYIRRFDTLVSRWNDHGTVAMPAQYGIVPWRVFDADTETRYELIPSNVQLSGPTDYWFWKSCE